MTDEPPHTRSFREKMLRYRGNIDNELYKAEQACPGNPSNYTMCFEPCDTFKMADGTCGLVRIRQAVGDHVEHHDIPQCDTGDTKPGCFGACGLPSCKIPGCSWFPRCKQSREDY